MIDVIGIITEMLDIQESLDVSSINYMLDYIRVLLNPEKQYQVASKKFLLEFNKVKFSDLEKRLVDKWLLELEDFDINAPSLYDGMYYCTFDELEKLNLIEVSKDRTTLTNVSKSLEGRLVLPDFIKNLRISLFSTCSLSEVILSDNIEIIPMHCFSFCNNLKEVKFGKNLKTIGAGAFAYSSIEKINPSDKISVIGDGAFEGCDKLEKEKYGSFFLK